MVLKTGIIIGKLVAWERQEMKSAIKPLK